MPSDERTDHADSVNPANQLKGTERVPGESTRTRVDAQKSAASGASVLIPQTGGLESRKRGLSDEMTTAVLAHIDRHYIGSRVVPSISESWKLFHYQQTARGAKQIPSYEQFRRAVKLRVEQQIIRRRRA